MAAEPWRVTQIVTDPESGAQGTRGSGYLVAPGIVLTAAHVLAGASTVRVRLDTGQSAEIYVRAERWWADPAGPDGTDLAVVMIPVEATAGQEAEPTRFGRIRDCTAVLAVQALGFPRFKLRVSGGGTADPGPFRDLDQITAHVPVAANRRQGTMAVYLDDPPPAVPGEDGLSPWEGMSGAAVWAGDRIIGVVAEHHASEGTGRLTARRVDHAYDQLREADLSRLVTWLGLAPAAAQLPDVVEADVGQQIQSAYLAQVRDIAPDALIGRDDELAEWAEFCAGTQAYTWWQASPWAGKSALAYWFVAHPPAGIDIVSFFITGRLSGQADGDAFLNAVVEQLGALDPVGGEPPRTAGARHGVWLSLLASTAARAKERGRRLVVVVDGLDEDAAGASPTWGRPSIASMLPRRPPDGARFIVTSRPDPGLPDDVPSDHPLRTLIPRDLSASRIAEDIERLAKQELQDLLGSHDQVAVSVVGCIAASGGGLTRTDLSALTGAPPYSLDPVLRGVSGRSLKTRPAEPYTSTATNPETRIYLFAHETLRLIAEEQLGSDLTRYRQQVHDWISSCASQGWPASTPGYAVRGYTAFLLASCDVSRLSALARSPGRHAFLLRATGSDDATLREIRDAQQLIAAQQLPDLQALVELAVYRHAISIRNQSIPVFLPAVWALLGRFGHAEALARTITRPDSTAWALRELAAVAAQRGYQDRAEELARTIRGPEFQSRALAQLAAVAAEAGDQDRGSRLAADAETLARSITDPGDQVWLLAELAARAVQAGDLNRAETLARSISFPGNRAQALAKLAVAAVRAGDQNRGARLAADAEKLAHTVTDPSSQAWTFAELAVAAAQGGHQDHAEELVRAIAVIDPRDQAGVLANLAVVAAQAGDQNREARLAADAEALTRTITDPRVQARALAELAVAAARAGNQDHAEGLARTIAKPDDQAWAFAELAVAAARAGNQDHAEGLARTITGPRHKARALAELAAVAARAGNKEYAEKLAYTITDLGLRAEALTWLAEAAAQAGDQDRGSRLAADAEKLARTIISPYDQPRVVAVLAEAAAQAGDQDHAEELARTIIVPYHEAGALTQLAEAAAQAGDQDRWSRLATDAEALARTIIGPSDQALVLARLAEAAAQAGDQDRWSRLVTDAEVLTRTMTGSYGQAEALKRLAAVVAKAGDQDHAEELARTITDPSDQGGALAQLAEAAAKTGDQDRAEELTRTITSPEHQARALAELAAVAAQAGDQDHAEELALTITSPDHQARALADLAAVAAKAGDQDHAEELARTITVPYYQGQALAQLAEAAAKTGDQDRAEELARTITDPRHKARAFAELAVVAAQAGDQGRGARLAIDAEELARTIISPYDQAHALAELAVAVARTGDPHRAESLAHAITRPSDQSWALSRLAAVAAQAGDLVGAENLARTVASPEVQTRALAELASVAAQTGEQDRARHLLALATAVETSEFQWWMPTMARLFPAVIRNAGDVFLSAYTAGA